MMAMKNDIVQEQAELIGRLLAPLKPYMDDMLAITFISAIWSDYSFLIGEEDVFQITMYVPSTLYNDRFSLNVMPPSLFATYEEWVRYMQYEFAQQLREAMQKYCRDGFQWTDFRNPQLAQRYLLKLGVKKEDLESAYVEWA